MGMTAIVLGMGGHGFHIIMGGHGFDLKGKCRSLPHTEFANNKSYYPWPSPTLGSIGPSQQGRHKSRVSLRGPPCANGISGTLHGEVHGIYNIHHLSNIPCEIIKGKVTFIPSKCFIM